MKPLNLQTTLSGALGAVFAISALATPQIAHALPEAYEQSIQAALHGPEKKNVWLFGHRFHVKPASITQSGGALRITGQLSHVLSYRPDDQVYYNMRLEGNELTLDIGQVVNEGIDIERGGVLFPVWWIGEAVEDLITEVFDLGPASEGALPYGQIPENVEELAQQGAGEWEEAASIVIAMVALRAWQERAPGSIYLNSNALISGSSGYNLTIRTLLNKYWSAEGEGGGMVNANRDVAQGWETLRLIDLNGGALSPGDAVRIAAPNGQFIVADGCGGSTVSATGTRYNACGRFTIELVSRASSRPVMVGTPILPDDVIALRTAGNRYLSAPGMNGRINAEPQWSQAWEHFKLSFTPKSTTPPILQNTVFQAATVSP